MDNRDADHDTLAYTLVHLVAGGAGGTAGAIVTCPLEVVKTRLQSSVATFQFQNHSTADVSVAHHPSRTLRSFFANMTIYRCLRYILETEGVRGLFKGLGPTVVGVAPSRAIYFSAYSASKSFYNDYLPPNSPLVHICSAGSAGIAACTVTNPVWFVKTRLQLDQRKDGGLTALRCVKQIYSQTGILGFYKGISASYVGVSETIIHFVIYESIKERILARNLRVAYQERTTDDFLRFMGAAATSKTIATTLAYPHEVARTRLRQEGTKYRKFWQTLSTVVKEEGYRGLYRGLTTHLIRQIPNTAVTMVVYETVVYLLSRSKIDPAQED
ncbi:solute carrier family 25 member 36-A-like isoform X2 [Paramacrobiotus metropolitanus]|uniref:solute carrier family 25 member 36-A-like isoform X2 n=1 Tax=Paramacrobiotus metropolitanus TaxID=2943436 RepID=UPI0024461FC1|nr:solute carrier family 25 member 36-A-like isoform X2 [Paramacrobiotus metropolitanus]